MKSYCNIIDLAKPVGNDLKYELSIRDTLLVKNTNKGKNIIDLAKLEGNDLNYELSIPKYLVGEKHQQGQK